jgi:hypothetical protein
MGSWFMEMFRGFDGADLGRAAVALMAFAFLLDWQFRRKK